MSTMMDRRSPPFKVLLGHGQVRDQYGEEMHKIEGQRDPVRRCSRRRLRALSRAQPKAKSKPRHASDCRQDGSSASRKTSMDNKPKLVVYGHAIRRWAPT